MPAAAPGLGQPYKSNSVPQWAGSSAGVAKGSVVFDGSGDYIQAPANAAFSMGAGDFAYECWWRPLTLASAQMLLAHADNTNIAGTGQFVIAYNTTLGLRFYGNQGNIDVTQGGIVGWTTGVWYHVAAVRSGTTLTLYRNGVSIASGASSAQIGTSTIVTQIGGDSYDPLSMAGNLSNVRIVKGSPVYTGAFTPPTSPLTAVAGTSLLTAQSPTTITDASTNAFTITAAGNAAASSLNPF